MLYECNLPRLLIIKYLPLLSGLLILSGLISKVINDNSDLWPDILLSLLLPFLFSILLLVLFFNFKDKLKYVAIGKSKVIIRNGGREHEYNWLDVETISLNRFIGLYKLKIRNEDIVYFTPYGMTTWFTGDNSDMGLIIDRMKRELEI